MRRYFIAILVVFLSHTALAQTEDPVIYIDDVSHFYKVYDAADGNPTAKQLQNNYIDTGSSGLRIFAQKRGITGEEIAQTLSEHPEIYTNARHCADVLPRVRQRLKSALQELNRFYPDAKLSPVTIAIGKGKPVGIGNPATGIQIGLEALCATDFLNPDLEDRFVYVIAHEYIHVQQASSEAGGSTVLEQSLLEGTAEFMGELISGEVAYSHLKAVVAGREKEIETRFVADLDKTDLSDWLYNTSVVGNQKGDLGYWVGYRIAKAYYKNATDKQQAIADIIEMTDAKAFLDASGLTLSSFYSSSCPLSLVQ